MSDDARTLGAALMQPNTVKPRVRLTGRVYGNTLREVAEAASEEAYSFFDEGAYSLDIDVELNSGGGPFKFVASYVAELR